MRHPRPPRWGRRGDGGGGTVARHRGPAIAIQPQRTGCRRAASLCSGAHLLDCAPPRVCFRATTTPTIRAATAMPATPTETIPGTRTRWSSAIAGTSHLSTPPMNHCRLSSSNRWCGASSGGAVQREPSPGLEHQGESTIGRNLDGTAGQELGREEVECNSGARSEV